MLSLNLRFYPEQSDSPYYHYSHGLKKHQGNCQRIAHGHRSKIEIWKNDQLDLQAMHEWCKKFNNIYIGTEEDVVEELSDEENYHLAYYAQQGNFSIQLPREHVYLIDTDSTVEHIALHIAQMLKDQNRSDRIKVKAYEGLWKGAIVEL